MSQDLMHYDKMTQLALRSVVRDAIRRVIREDGLPGAHHFYITFMTRFPGVDVDDALVEKYPEEITIVLEHQYWDLKAHNDSFEVTLKFGGVPKYISVPYTAITRFHDPSVGFALQFDIPEEMKEAPPTLARIATQPRAVDETKPGGSDQPGEVAPLTKLKPAVPFGKKGAAVPAAKKDKDTADDKAPPSKSGEDKPKKEEAKTADADKAGTVVSLDSFRKK